MNRKILKSSLLITAITALSALVEMLKDIVVAKTLGTTVEGDAFFAALTIPMLVIGTLLQSVRISIIPLLSQASAQKGETEVKRLGDVLITLAFPILLIFFFVGVLASPWIIQLVGAGFNAEVKNLATRLSQILFPATFLVGFTALIISWLNSKQYFASAAAINLARSLGMIAVIMLLTSRWGVFAVAMGFTLGSFFQLLLVGFDAWRRGFRWSFSLDTNAQELKKISGLLAWPASTLFLRQANILIERMFASMVAMGGIAALSYAYRPVFALNAIFSTSVFTAALPTISGSAGENNKEQLQIKLTSALRLVSLFVFPLAVGSLVLRMPIVTLLYQRGAFNAQSTEMTASVFQYYIASLPAVALIPIFNLVFYATLDMKMPVLIAVSASFVNIALDSILVKYMGLNGLALGYFLSRVFELVAILFFLRRRHLFVFTKMLLSFYTQLIMIVVVMGGAVYLAQLQLSQILDGGTLAQLLMLGLSATVGAIIFIALLALFRVDEFFYAIDLARKKLK